MRLSFIKARRSLFTRLILIMVGAGLLLFITVSVFFLAIFTPPNHHRSFHRHLDAYSDYIIAGLGTPPDRERALAISRRVNMDIAVIGAGISWRTAEIPPFEDGHFGVQKVSAEFPFTLLIKRRGFMLIKKAGPYTYRFFNRTDRLIEPRYELLPLLLVFVALIITATFFLVKRVLIPIPLLHSGVEEIKKGNLDMDVAVIRNDELGDLTRAFNQMRTRIKEMLRAREQLLSDVSHELRSPLTRIKVALEFIKDEDMRKSITDDIRDIETMITEILETARLNYRDGRLELKPVDLTGLAATLLADRAHSGRNHVFKTRTPAMIKGEESLIKTVIRNILDNAEKYSPKHSPAEIYIEADESLVSLSVRDHGTGIPESELPFVFEPFYRIDKSRSRETGGYGLGLSLCKTIMEAHGGSISVDSIPGEGTTVTLIFPALNVPRKIPSQVVPYDV